MLRGCHFGFSSSRWAVLCQPEVHTRQPHHRPRVCQNLTGGWGGGGGRGGRSQAKVTKKSSSAYGLPSISISSFWYLPPGAHHQEDLKTSQFQLLSVLLGTCRSRFYLKYIFHVFIIPAPRGWVSEVVFSVKK